MRCFSIPKRIPNKQYLPELKQIIVEAVIKEGLSYKEAARISEITERDRIQNSERIYLIKVPKGLAVEHSGHGSKGRPSKQLPKDVE